MAFFLPYKSKSSASLSSCLFISVSHWIESVSVRWNFKILSISFLSQWVERNNRTFNHTSFYVDGFSIQFFPMLYSSYTLLFFFKLWFGFGYRNQNRYKTKQRSILISSFMQGSVSEIQILWCGIQCWPISFNYGCINHDIDGNIHQVTKSVNVVYTNSEIALIQCAE